MKLTGGGNQRGHWTLLTCAVLTGLAALGSSWALAAMAQTEVQISSDATPQIQQVKPSQASAGNEVTVTIEGRNFSSGAYVSFASPAVHVVSTRRLSDSQLEAKLAIGTRAQAGTLSLFVSNPASPVAEARFTIAGTTSSPPPALTPQAPATETKPSQAATPEVTAVDPPRVSPGGQASLKITGKNFAEGVKVSFSNPGIRVLETSSMSTELTTRIQIAADAPTGKSSLFVVNPGDREVEVPFEVTGSAPATPAAPTSGPAASETTGSTAQRFEVFNLGDVVSIFQNPSKPKGVLVLSGSKLAYEEDGKEVFSAPLRDIKEVDVNSIAGFNTGTFHLRDHAEIRSLRWSELAHYFSAPATSGGALFSAGCQ